jgi:hypothetical protein
MRAWQIFTKRGKPVVDTTGRLVIYARKRDAKFHCSESHPGRRYEPVNVHKSEDQRHDIEDATYEDTPHKGPYVGPFGEMINQEIEG